MALAGLWLLFAAANAEAWHRTGRPAGFGAVALELLIVVLFVSRRETQWVSRSPVDWIVALGGTLGPLAARPVHASPDGTAWIYEAVQLGGALCASVCLLTLGRAFGIVPAFRQLRTSGPYRLVRHPVYASYMVVEIGYLLENPTLRNAGIFAAATVCQLMRIRREEACLMRDDAYSKYCRQVRYRVLPLVY